MNVLLLGNGFDLYHNLPTKYINFINTVSFLSNNTLFNIKTIGDVFGDMRLHQLDKDILKSYDIYKDAYHSIQLDGQTINKLSSLTQNMWFSYFLQSFNKNVGWIDFEEEIATVVHSFQELFIDDNPEILSRERLTTEKARYIVRIFNFYIEDATKGYLYLSYNFDVKNEFKVEYPLGSRNFIINKEKIVDILLKELLELAEGLKLYLSCFVENILDVIHKEKQCEWHESFNYVSSAITFNYTNTYEKLYEKEKAFHIHGDVNDKIVLGINPDIDDRIGTTDISFLSFKKYFQRVVYKTDVSYLEFIKDAKEMYADITLFVIGHSLDVTDKDIIEELFEVSNRIIILNYDELDERKHISNLVKIFGKEVFDRMRYEKNLTFLPIDTDCTEIMKKQADIDLTIAYNL